MQQLIYLPLGVQAWGIYRPLTPTFPSPFTPPSPLFNLFSIYSFYSIHSIILPFAPTTSPLFTPSPPLFYLVLQLLHHFLLHLLHYFTWCSNYYTTFYSIHSIIEPDTPITTPIFTPSTPLFYQVLQLLHHFLLHPWHYWTWCSTAPPPFSSFTPLLCLCSNCSTTCNSIHFIIIHSSSYSITYHTIIVPVAPTTVVPVASISPPPDTPPMQLLNLLFQLLHPCSSCLQNMLNICIFPNPLTANHLMILLWRLQFKGNQLQELPTNYSCYVQD